MGASSQSSHSTMHQSVTPTNPSWVTSGLGAFGNTLAGLQNLDPYSLVSGANSQQTSAGNLALGLGGGSTARLTDGASYVAPEIYSGGGRAPSVLDNLPAYEDPYLDSVVNSSLAGFDYNAGQQAAANKLALANDATFGGSGGAIQTALSNSQLATARAQLQSGLLNQGYNTALGAATTDAQLRNDARNRAVQASIAQANAQLQAEQLRQAAAQGLDANTRANIAAQLGAGDALRTITQQQKLAPVTTAASLGGIWGSLPLSLLHGQDTSETSDSTQTNTPSLLSQIGQGIGIASSLFGMGGLSPISLMSLPTAEPMTLFSGPLTQHAFSVTPS